MQGEKNIPNHNYGNQNKSLWITDPSQQSNNKLQYSISNFEKDIQIYSELI